MGKGSPESFTPKQIEVLVERLEHAAQEVKEIGEKMVAEGVEKIVIENSAAYDRFISELKRWKRSAEDGLDDARRPKKIVKKAVKKSSK